jgi:protein-tyrosine phosphatase
MKPSSPLLPGTFNSRDIGGLPAYGGEVRHGRIIRSDAPVELRHRGRDLLTELGLATAIDLREPSEREVDRVDLSGLGVELRLQPALGEHFEFLKEMTLEDVYRHLIESSGENLTAAVRRLAAPDALPALVFCSAGKDRTGLVIARVLGALGVPDDAIVADYTRSEDSMSGEFRAVVQARARAAGVDEQELATRVGAPPALMRSTLAWLHARHGGASGYLRSHGMTNAELDRLRGALVAPRAANAA